MARKVFDEELNEVDFDNIKIGEFYYTFEKLGITQRYYDKFDNCLKLISDKNINREHSICESCGEKVRLVNPGLTGVELEKLDKKKIPHVKQYKCNCGKFKAKHLKTGLEFTANSQKANWGIKFVIKNADKRIFGIIEDNGKNFKDNFSEEKVVIFYETGEVSEKRYFLHNSFYNTKDIEKIEFTEPYYLLESFGSSILTCRQHIKTIEEHEKMKTFIRINDKLTMLENIIEQTNSKKYKRANYDEQISENNLFEIDIHSKTVKFNNEVKTIDDILDYLKKTINNEVELLSEEKIVTDSKGKLVKKYVPGELYFLGYDAWDILGNSLGLSLKAGKINKHDIIKLFHSPLRKYVEDETGVKL